MGLLGGNAAPLAAGVVGAAVSVACPWVFYWLGGRITGRQNGVLLKQLNELRKLLAHYVLSMSKRLDLPNAVQERQVELSAGGKASRSLGAWSLTLPPTSFVRGSLGALVNKRGEVDMSRLMREVSLAASSKDLSATFEVRWRTHSRGVVEQDGAEDSLEVVRTVHVRTFAQGA